MFLHRVFLGERSATTLDDVARNVGYILDTKRGAGHFLSDFGLTDAGYKTPQEIVVALREEITETLTRYEPRIVLGQAEEVYDDDGRVYVHLTCRVRSGGKLLIVADPRERKIRVETAP